MFVHLDEQVEVLLQVRRLEVLLQVVVWMSKIVVLVGKHCLGTKCPLGPQCPK